MSTNVFSPVIDDMFASLSRRAGRKVTKREIYSAMGLLDEPKLQGFKAGKRGAELVWSFRDCIVKVWVVRRIDRTWSGFVTVNGVEADEWHCEDRDSAAWEAAYACHFGGPRDGIKGYVHEYRRNRTR